MRSLFALLLVYVLAFLLVGTSPVGAGQGAHQNQLLDALIPHVHFVDGKIIPPGATQAPAPELPSGIAIGAGAGAAGASSGLVIAPAPVKIGLPGVRVGEDVRPQAPADDALPRGREEAPPDPPPDTRS